MRRKKLYAMILAGALVVSQTLVSFPVRTFAETEIASSEESSSSAVKVNGKTKTLVSAWSSKKSVKTKK